MAVDPEEVAAALLSLYEFLVGMYLPGCALLRPPAGGWPQISMQTLHSLHKTDTSIAILKAIPYVRRDYDEHRTSFNIYTRCHCVDYTDKSLHAELLDFGRQCGGAQFDIGVDVLPSHVILLADMDANNGTSITLDTESGKVRRWNKISKAEDIFDGINDLCNAIKADFRALKVIPYSSVDVRMMIEDDDERARAAHIYNEHGWPTDQYRRGECQKALEVFDDLIFKRNEFASELKSLYELMVSLYLPDDALVVPPPEGWSNINSKTLAILEKDHWVIDLLKHLPFLRRDDIHGEELYHMWEASECVDYRGAYARDCLEARSSQYFEWLEDEGGVVPPNIALLGNAKSNCGFYIYVDVNRGEISRWNSVTEYLDTFDDIFDFCKTMRSEFRNFGVLIHYPTWLVRCDGVYDDEEQKIMETYMECGWPDGKFDKWKCAARLRELLNPPTSILDPDDDLRD